MSTDGLTGGRADGRTEGRMDGPKTIVPFDLRRGTNITKIDKDFTCYFLVKSSQGQMHFAQTHQCIVTINVTL